MWERVRRTLRCRAHLLEGPPAARRRGVTDQRSCSSPGGVSWLQVEGSGKLQSAALSEGAGRAWQPTCARGMSHLRSPCGSRSAQCTAPDGSVQPACWVVRLGRGVFALCVKSLDWRGISYAWPGASFAPDNVIVTGRAQNEGSGRGAAENAPKKSWHHYYTGVWEGLGGAPVPGGLLFG